MWLPKARASSFPFYHGVSYHPTTFEFLLCRKHLQLCSGQTHCKVRRSTRTERPTLRNRTAFWTLYKVIKSWIDMRVKKLYFTQIFFHLFRLQVSALRIAGLKLWECGPPRKADFKSQQRYTSRCRKFSWHYFFLHYFFLEEHLFSLFLLNSPCILYIYSLL